MTNDNKNVGSYSTGNYSTGNYSTGSYSTGNCSAGDCSAGDRSTGDYSTGDYSTGNRSAGDYSTGYYSTGNYSTGNYSTGDRSTGDWSTGDWSISRFSTGHFSTIDDSGFGVFNKPCTRKLWNNAEKPNFLYFDLTEWIDTASMTNAEKIISPEHSTTGGYLKVYDYKEAWAKAWAGADDKDKALLYALPNFDAQVFEEISGIDVNAQKTRTIEITEETYQRIKNEL